MQRHDVASTLRRRCIDVMCLLGTYYHRLASHVYIYCAKYEGLLVRQVSNTRQLRPQRMRWQTAMVQNLALITSTSYFSLYAFFWGTCISDPGWGSLFKFVYICMKMFRSPMAVTASVSLAQVPTLHIQGILPILWLVKFAKICNLRFNIFQQRTLKQDWVQHKCYTTDCMHGC